MNPHRVLRFVCTALRVPARPPDDAWRRILDFADRTQLTLFLDGASVQPVWFQQQVGLRAVKNAERLRRLQIAYREISGAFSSAAIPFVLLKGFTHQAFGIDLLQRVQYDLDLLCEPHRAAAALDLLRKLGYAPHSERSLSDQHLPPLVKPHQWKWSGDYFDPAMPIAVELHTALWNASGDRIRLQGPDMFWNRRSLDFPAFILADRLAFASLHALRHILRNDARPAHVMELACFLETRARDDSFWRHWQDLHDPRLRAMQAVTFRFAREWFQCRLPSAAEQEVDRLSSRARVWFEEFAWSPVLNLLAPNKDVLWLHMALLSSVRDCLTVLRRRLLPLHVPGRGGVGERASYHASAILPALASGFRWCWRSTASRTTPQTSS